MSMKSGIMRCMIFIVAMLMLTAAFGNAEAATCQASASLPIFPVPSTDLTVGELGGTTVTITNTSSTVPPPPTVAAKLVGDIFFKLACADANCVTELPGILTFVNCTAADPNVASCALDLVTDPTGNTVKITTTATGISLTAGEALHVLATINWQVTDLVTTCTGTFFERGDTSALITNDAACTVQVTGAAAGSSSLSAPTLCPAPLVCEP